MGWFGDLFEMKGTARALTGDENSWIGKALGTAVVAGSIATGGLGGLLAYGVMKGADKLLQNQQESNRQSRDLISEQRGAQQQIIQQEQDRQTFERLQAAQTATNAAIRRRARQSFGATQTVLGTPLGAPATGKTVLGS